MIDAEVVQNLPKVVLHDHLDGGLRPETVLELAESIGYEDLQLADPIELGAFFRRGADTVDLVAYLAGFDHTCAITQTAEAIHRVAREFVEDLADDGVVHGEVRFAPERHTLGELSLDDVLEAASDGLRVGSLNTGVSVRSLVTIMRSGPNCRQVAEAAVRWRERTDGHAGGVVGLDLAGPELGYPAAAHIAGFEIAHAADLPITIHAGEADGLSSIRQALHPCGAVRIGHGVRIMDDIAEDGTLGRLASYVRDQGIPLELCPTSNVHTGAVPSFTQHPLPLLRDLGFHVTLNPDDKLMSGITVTSEYLAAVERWGWDLDDLEYVVRAATQAAFLPLTERRRLLDVLVTPGFAAAREATMADAST